MGSAMHHSNTSKARILAALFAVFSVQAKGADTSANATAVTPPPEEHKSSDTKGSPFRDFYQVLDDLMGDFEYDLRNGNVSGLKDVAIRNIATSENIPPSFRSHLELLITERILQSTKTRMIQCLACKSKHTKLNGDQVVITSNENNPVELARIAKTAGISNFMDLAFAYEPSGMILSMYITDPDSGAVIWSRSYNSEMSRAAAFRKGVDYSQMDQARRSTEYIPTVQYRATIYYLFEPDVGQTTGTLAAGFRMMERYDNRKKEVGFELDINRDSGTIAGGVPANSTLLYTGFNLTMLFMHSWNLIGSEENFNQMRGNIFAGIGGSYTSGFLGGLIRGGYEWRLGKKSAVTAALGYRPTSTAFVSSAAVGAVAGVEYGLGVSLLF